MILKEIDNKQFSDKYQQYGHKAEKQMAFYLKRAFQDIDDVFVINDLRLTMNGDTAQIDHLIIHRFGFIILESKSVVSEISINKHGEWTRHYQKIHKGIPSPIKQAMRQVDFLKKFLNTSSENLLKKTSILKTSVLDFKFDVLVAISDSGIVNRPKGYEFVEVLKADQISDKIKKKISDYASTNKKLFSLKINYHFKDSSMENIANYLIQSHTPLNCKIDSDVETEKSYHEKRNTRKKDQVCSKCASKNVKIAYGKYGYYFKCLDCNGNTSIKLQCSHKSCKPRIRKDKLRFYKECSSCKTSELYFENDE